MSAGTDLSETLLDQARLSSVVNKQVLYNVPFQEIPNVFSILKRILGKLGFPGLPLRCVAETSLQVSAVLRSKLYMSLLGGGANMFCGSKQNKCGKHA